MSKAIESSFEEYMQNEDNELYNRTSEIDRATKWILMRGLKPEDFYQYFCCAEDIIPEDIEVYITYLRDEDYIQKIYENMDSEHPKQALVREALEKMRYRQLAKKKK